MLPTSSGRPGPFHKPVDEAHFSCPGPQVAESMGAMVEYSENIGEAILARGEYLAGPTVAPGPGGT